MNPELVPCLEAPAPPAVKPGYLTTEFYGKCAVQLIAILVLVGIIPSGDQAHATEVSIGLITAMEAFYNLARGMAKSGLR